MGLTDDEAAFYPCIEALSNMEQKKSMRLHINSLYHTDTPPARETLPILYRDEGLVAVNKPSGLLVHRSMIDRHEQRFAVQILRDQLGQHVYPLHRLDKGTSGVLLFALDQAVARQAGQLFETRDVHKTYHAIVRGHPPEHGLIDHPLKTIRDDLLDTTGPEKLQEARTRFWRRATAEIPHAVDRYPGSRYALLELEPETGRRHQLRRHLKHIAHPIIGDATYGKGRHNRLFQTLFDSHRLLLLCARIQLRHPLRGNLLTIAAPPDAAFLRVMQGLGWASSLTDAAAGQEADPRTI